jgi:hypothetical protein
LLLAPREQGSSLLMIHRTVVLVNCCLGIAGVSIQLGLLLPWHEVISEDMHKLTAETVSLRNEIDSLKLQITTLNGQATVRAAARSGGWWWWGGRKA